MSHRRMAAWAVAICLAAGSAWFTARPGSVGTAPPARLDAVPPAILLNDDGIRLLDGGDLEGAIGAFKQARFHDAYSDTIARNLSLAILRKAQVAAGPESARELLDEALAAWPENPEALDLLSAIHYRAGRYRQAWDMATRLAAFYPDRPGIAGFVAHLEQRLDEEEGLTTEAGDRFRIRYSGERKLNFEGELVAAFQQEMDALTASLGIFPSDQIEILLLTEELGERAVPFDPDVSGLYDGRIRLYLGAGLPQREQLLKVVRHELVHAILHRAGQPMPVWFQEGAAQMLGESPSDSEVRNLRTVLANAAAGGWDMQLADASPSFLSLPKEDRALAYAASLAFVEHLIGRHGRNLIPILAAEMARGTGFEASLREATGSDLAALREEFMRSLE